MKILKPRNLNLEALIDDNKKYDWCKNIQGKLVYNQYLGKNIRKYIPQMYYFISAILMNSTKEKYKCELKEFDDHTYLKLCSLSEVGINYKKSKQIIHFLVANKIIKVKGLEKEIYVNNKTYRINLKYFSIQPPFKSIAEIYDIKLEFKELKLNAETKAKISSSPVFKYQHEKQKELNFDFSGATQTVNELYYSKVFTDLQFLSYYNLIRRIYNKQYYFKISDKCNRVFTTINGIPKILRCNILDKGDNVLNELDYANFNVLLLCKIFTEYKVNNIVNENYISELEKFKLYIDNDFYESVMKTMNDSGISKKYYGMYVDRDTVKEDIVLKHWINAYQWDKSAEHDIMLLLFPELSIVLKSLKGLYKSTCNEFYNSFMKKESELVNDIVYKRIMTELPESICYTLFDGLLVDNKNTDQIIQIMSDEGKKYMGYDIKVRKK